MFIILLTYGTFFKLHDVLCQGTSFVRKHIFDLSQLFVQVRRPCQGIGPLVTHFNVIVNKVSLKKFHTFKCDQQGNRYEVIIQNNKSQAIEEKVASWAL